MKNMLEIIQIYQHSKPPSNDIKNPEGLRKDMKRDLNFEPSLEDPCVNTQK